MQSSLTRFGRFELKGLLGRSTRTMVWRAFDPVASREVMLCLPRSAPGNAAAVDTWLREARHAARLEHPQIVPVLEVGVHNNWPFLTCDRTAGVTLREYLATKSELAPTHVAAWAAQTLQALAYAHDGGVFHGDLQLHFLIVDDKGRVRVMALGCGEDPVSAARRSAGGEQELDVQRVAIRRDLLAVGVILHRVLTGLPVLNE